MEFKLLLSHRDQETGALFLIIIFQRVAPFETDIPGLGKIHLQKDREKNLQLHVF